MGRLAEAWIAPPELRELRELVRYRAKLVHLRTGLKAQVHAVLAKEGVHVPMTDLFGVAGQNLLDTCELAEAYTVRVESLRDVMASSTGRLRCCSAASTQSWPMTPATTPSRPFPAWVRCSAPSSSPRSATSPASRAPITWRHGRA